MRGRVPVFVGLTVHMAILEDVDGSVKVPGLAEGFQL